MARGRKRLIHRRQHLLPPENPQLFQLPAARSQALIQALTREEAEGTLNGRIPALLDSGELEKLSGCELKEDNSTVLLCGNPAMLDDMEEKLGTRGLKRHRSKSPGQIVLERYW